MTSQSSAPKKRTRTRRKKPGAGATAANFVFFLAIVSLTYIYQSLAWLLIVVGSFVLVMSVVVIVRGEPDAGSPLAAGAIGFGMAAVGVVLVLVLIRKFDFRFWETIPFLPGPVF